MSLISMDNEDYYKPGFFDILIQPKTYTSMFYSLISIPLYTLYFAITLLGFLLGTVLLPIWIGVPVLSAYFKLIWFLSKKEENIFENRLYSPISRISRLVPNSDSSFKEFKSFITNKRSWKRIAYFLSKPIVSVIFSIPLFTFMGLIFTMIYTPIKSVFGHIQLYDFYKTDSFIEVIFFYFISFIIAIGLIHLIVYSVKLSAKIATVFLSR
jgi:hypothetical protein